MTRPIILILSGIPCSGKTTFRNNFIRDILWFTHSENPTFVSRDEIRIKLFGKEYKQNNQDERKVTEEFYRILNLAINLCSIIILDNTYCQEKYIQEIYSKYSDKARINVMFFDIPLWKAYWRNLKRYFKERKWIPLKVINKMKKDYNKIDKSKYKNL